MTFDRFLAGLHPDDRATDQRVSSIDAASGHHGNDCEYRWRALHGDGTVRLVQRGVSCHSTSPAKRSR